MANNSHKTPLSRSLDRLARHRVLDAFELSGKGLNCSIVSMNGSIAKIKFDANAAPFTLPQITVPVWGPEYIRYPYQPKEVGVVVPFDVLLGAITGLGGSATNLDLPPSNLGALVFTGISSLKWSAVADPNKIDLYGPNGFNIHDAGNNCTVTGDKNNITVTAKQTLTLQVGSKSIVITSSGVTIDGIPWDTHRHGGVVTGGAVSLGPQA